MTKTPAFFFTATFTMLFLGIFYFTVTNMAGIYIVSELGGSTIISVYAMAFYGLGNAVSIPLSKHLIEKDGLFAHLIKALILFTLFSFFCSFSTTYPAFIFFRFLQGFSAGPFFLLTKKLIDLYAPDSKKSFFNSFSILLYGIVPVIGACYGAFIAYEFDWTWIFHTGQPISFFLIFYFISAFKKMKEPLRNNKPFNYYTYLFYALGISSFGTLATLAQEIDWFTSYLFIFLLFTSFIALALFIYFELYKEGPIFHLCYLKDFRLSYCLLNTAILFSSYFGMIILIALWLKIYASYTPMWIAAILAAMAIAGTIGYLINRRWLRLIDPRFPLGIGMLFLLLSCTYSVHFDVYVDFFHLAVARSLAGFGLVFFIVPLIYLLVNLYKEEKQYEALMQFHVVRTLFSSLGAALYVTLWHRRQIFFHERLGENLTTTSLLTKEYFQRAKEIFYLTKGQSIEQLEVLLTEHATSLGLNDTFGFMGAIVGLLLLLLISTFFLKKVKIELGL